MMLHPVCEYVDRNGTRLLITVWLRGSDVRADSRYSLRLRSRFGRRQMIVHAAVSQRVDTYGTWTNSSVRFEVDCRRLPAGAYALELSREAASDYVRVEPSAGVLANSRLEELGGRRMQVLPGAGRPLTWIRITSWKGVARIAWKVRNAVRDVAFFAHRRRFFWVRALRLLTWPIVPRGPIWLIGERPETARDNGRALFRYLRTERPNANVYYVIAANSPMRGAVAPLGNVVLHSSWRHRVLMLHATVLANAYSIKHMLPTRWHPSAYMKQCAWRIGSLRVYLKHGVHLSPYALKRANGGYDLVVTVGPRETAAIARTSGYAENQLVQTGLARYDDLVAIPATRTILFMLTWRRYFVPTLFSGDDSSLMPYDGSSYQKFVDEFLSSERLAAILARVGAQLVAVPHYNLASVSRWTGAKGRVRVLDGATADIPELLRSCDLLITDYSSVQFDVAYVGTPIVYAQFDEREFATRHGSTSWFDSARDGFGPVTTDVEGTLDAVEYYADRGFRREAHYGDRVATIFAYGDRRNCERITGQIDRLVARS